MQVNILNAFIPDIQVSIINDNFQMKVNYLNLSSLSRISINC